MIIQFCYQWVGIDIASSTPSAVSRNFLIRFLNGLFVSARQSGWREFQSLQKTKVEICYATFSHEIFCSVSAGKGSPRRSPRNRRQKRNTGSDE